MNTSDFNFNLPKDCIAQSSVDPRDHSKLMIINRDNKTVEHKQFFDIVTYFDSNDVIVWNNSKVFKARLFGALTSQQDEPLMHHTKEIELFLVRPTENEGVWHAMAKPAKHIDHGMRIRIAEDFYCDVIIKKKDGTLLVQFPLTDNEVREKANEYGHIPIPPYVKDEPLQFESYQTVYASNEKEGSVAAPTAGFHFTDEIISTLKEKGVTFVDITLHVGLGTFLPVKSESIDNHIMHSEWAEVSEQSALAIQAAKKSGKRIITVGTTATRTLEGVATLHTDNNVHAFNGDIDIFITPGYEFKVVDALITNFHLPKSTLLMLVSAFIGDREWTLELYTEAVEKAYRFYSFGDAMLVL